MSKGILQGAQNFKIENAEFYDGTRVEISHSLVHINGGQVSMEHSGRAGLRTLLEKCIPEAAHDSGARYPPPLCHPGTRREYIDSIMHWVTSGAGRVGPILWLKGPAGVGKSAVAQFCAEALGDKLGAAFFFSQPNSRNDPNRFFTSIAYQLATRIDSYGDVLNHKLSRDPTLVTKSIKQQFQDLIAIPLQELRAQGNDVGERAVIVDGLDECAGSRAQCDIIEVVAASARQQATPLLWIIFSRPETHITATFASPQLSSLCSHMEIPVSRAIDNEVARYLTDELRKIQRDHGLPPSWPSERAIRILVYLSAGLFSYAENICRFIGEKDSLGPEDQLHALLMFAIARTNDGANHPFPKLDVFYTDLIMRRIPTGILLTAQKILLATTFCLKLGTKASVNASFLGLSESQFRSVCRSLHSVLRLEGQPPEIQFYHASFMQFLEDRSRSGNFSIRSACAAFLWTELLEKLNIVHTHYHSSSSIMPVTWPSFMVNGPFIYQCTVQAFFALTESIPLDTGMLDALSEFDYSMIPVIEKNSSFSNDELSVQRLLRNIPEEYRSKIIRPHSSILSHPSLLPIPDDSYLQGRVYVLGQGKRKVLCAGTGSWDGGLVIIPYPSYGRIMVHFTCYVTRQVANFMTSWSGFWWCFLFISFLIFSIFS